ncbi:MAG: hypothetical protein K9M94_07605 [Spirochaetia bacterium]|nr:hypothetical protein [Spirochaetia bacterium]
MPLFVGTQYKKTVDLYFFHASIAELRAYLHLLTPADVKTLYMLKAAGTGLVTTDKLAVKAREDISQSILDTLGSLAFENQVELSKLGSTVIEGGYLKTVLIDLVSLFSKQITIKNGGLIESDNYQEGISGFRLNSDGHADLNDVSVRNYPAKLAANIEVTVGVSGDFLTINEALKFLTGYVPVYEAGGISATVKLKSGFVMEEQVLVKGVNLSWIRIISEDSQVTINRASLVSEMNYELPAFGVEQGGSLPAIDCLFSMDNSVSTSVVGIYANNGGRVIVEVGAGVIDVTDGYGLYVENGSYADALSAKFSNAAIGVLANSASSINFSGGEAKNCFFGVHCLRASSVNAISVDVSNCSDYGFNAVECGKINAHQGEATGAGLFGFRVMTGGLINAYYGNGTLSIPKNSLRSEGIIFQ